MAKVLFSCEITEDAVLGSWRAYLQDPTATLPDMADIPASFVVAAMEDAALAMLCVLLVDRAAG